jgi:peroxiredoxin
VSARSLPARSARPTRRALLVGAGGLPVALLLAACGTDTSDRYASGDAGYISGDGVATEIAPPDRGEPLEVVGTTYDDEEFSSVDRRGDLLVLNVWYASCPPCRKEAPDLQGIHEEYQDQGVFFIGVNVRDTAGPARAFEETYGITYPSMPDPDAEIMYSLRGQVAPNAVPSTLVLDREGRVAARVSGAADPSVLRAMIDAVITE